ncbi:MAG: MotA/TolQ/ExbB proton channel family protein [Planctomycetota bacterium]
MLSNTPLDSVTSLLAQATTPSVFELATKGGIMMIPITLCSLVVVAVVLERLAVLRLPRVIVPGFEKKLHDAMETRDTEQARAVCKKNDSPAARVIAAGLDKLGHSNEVVEKHLTAAGENELFLLRRRLRVLTVIAAVAPLLGLTGTIFGMIRAFQTVAISGDSLGKAELLAGGIYEAMITTAAGLLVAMPTIIFYHWLSSKVDRLARELDRIAVDFVERYVLERPPAPKLASPSQNGAVPLSSVNEPMPAGVEG